MNLNLFIPVFLSAALIAVCAVTLSGCYTLKQGTTMLGYLSRAVPLESLSGTGDTTGTGNDSAEISEAEKNRRFVELVQDIRRFAIEELGLSMSKNYTRYVYIDRSYLAAVVSAVAADSFTRHEWKYPVVGVMPYKGFFNVEDARKERIKLEKKGLDVWIRGVDAFSTLGWFRDPLYSYMRDYSPDRLADLIIHESLHATVFIKGQAQFNEELAEFVGTEGARLYMVSRFGEDSDEYRAMFAGEEDSRSYMAFIQELAAELQALYTSEKGRDEKLREKEQIINSAKSRFEAEYESRFSNDNYRNFSSLPINNAYIDLFRLYYAGDNFFADLYERSGKNLPAFIAAAKTMSKKKPRDSENDSSRKRLAAALGLE
jgi:predicted aminopeptidase